jgi:hypothetical protein
MSKDLFDAVKREDVSQVSTLLKSPHSISTWNTVSDGDGNTVLHLASKNKKADVLEVILQAGVGVGVNVTNKLGQTPLHIACTRGRESAVLVLLLHGARTCVKSNSGKTPISIAKEKRLTSIITILEAFATVRSATPATDVEMAVARERAHWEGEVAGLRKEIKTLRAALDTAAKMAGAKEMEEAVVEHWEGMVAVFHDALDAPAP